MMVVTLANSLNTTSLEGKAITVLERLEVREEMIHLAASVITLFAKVGFGWKYNIMILILLQKGNSKWTLNIDLSDEVEEGYEQV